MSKPRKHHYVSKVLIDKFKNANGVLYFYDKVKDIQGRKHSSKAIFFEKDLNTTISENGEIDYNSVENNLNQNFETDFNTHYGKLLESINEESVSVPKGSIHFLIGMGIIGEARTPRFQNKAREVIFGTLEQIASRATDKLKAEIEASISQPYNISLDFKEVCEVTMSLMGEIVYSLFRAPTNEYYFLPDCTSLTIRSQLEEDIVIDENTYINPSRPISTVILPLNSKLLLVAQASKLCPHSDNRIYSLTSDLVYDYNKSLLEHAQQRIVCENEYYLKAFVRKYLMEINSKSANLEDE
jgi:hypothetical protein